MSEQFISRYQLKEEIGRGGMGKVYRAFDRQLQRHVALKLIANRDLESPRMVARFKREAQAASSLNHPNICTIHDFGEHDGTPFFVMELVEGQSLDRLLHHESISWQQVVKIGIQIAEGLQAAHDRGIIHRDIKPGNIILTPAGTVKILDFGIAKLSETDKTAGAGDGTSLTQSGSLLGTVRYCSPEQALGREVDQRSDLFSLGLVLYEMVTGEHPFEGDTQASRINSLLNREPAPLRTRISQIPPALESLIRRLLAKEPGKRPPNARDVADLLRRVSSGETPPLPAVGSLVWKRPLVLIVLLIAIVVGVYWYWGNPGSTVQVERNLALLPLVYEGPETRRPNATMFPALLSEAFRSSSGLDVAPFETSRQYDPTADLHKTRRELGVSWLLTGAMTVTDPLYTMRLQLSHDSESSWNREYRGEIGDLFSIAGQVSTDIAEALGQDSLSSSGLLGQDRSAVRFYLEGQRYLEGWDVESNAERARESFSKAVEIDPDFGEAQAGLARSLWKIWEETGNPDRADEAGDAATRAVETSPSNPASHLALGVVQLGRGQSPQAVASFERAQILAPADDGVCRNIADAYARLGQAAEAEKMYRKAISLRPDVWQNYRALGNFLLAEGRFEEAKQPYRHIIRLRPQSDIGHNNLALVHLSLGEFEEAEVHLLAAITIQPTMAGHTNLGFVFYSTGRYQEAADQFIEATRFSPDESPWLSLGDAYRQLGEGENAEKAYRQAISISRGKLTVDSNDPELRSRLGYSLAGIGDCEGAFGELGIARQSGSKSPWIAYYNAISHALCGQQDLATEALIRAVEGGLKADVQTNPDLRQLLEQPAVKRALDSGRAAGTPNTN